MFRKEKNVKIPNVNQLLNTSKIQRRYFVMPVVKIDFITYPIEKKITRSMNLKRFSKEIIRLLKVS